MPKLSRRRRCRDQPCDRDPLTLPSLSSPSRSCTASLPVQVALRCNCVSVPSCRVSAPGSALPPFVGWHVVHVCSVDVLSRTLGKSSSTWPTTSKSETCCSGVVLERGCCNFWDMPFLDDAGAHPPLVGVANLSVGSRIRRASGHISLERYGQCGFLRTRCLTRCWLSWLEPCLLV